MDVLNAGARALGVELDAAQLRAFRVYADELLAWNAKFNLTAITARDEIDRRHFLDSLAALPLIRSLYPPAPNAPPAAAQSDPDGMAPRPVTPQNLRMLDVGAGPGFPGVPLKLACPAWQLTLLEATRKKCDFLEHLALVLPLPETRVLWARAETAAHLPAEREQYDLVVARAVAELNVLAEYMLPFARVGGYCLAWKSEVAGELRAAERAIALLGGRLGAAGPDRSDGVLAVQIPSLDAARSLVLIEKVAPTPQTYPRREGMPAKRPLR